MQNEFLVNFRAIPVFGLTTQALQHNITIAHPDGTADTKTIGDFIIGHNCIQGIEQTNHTVDLGKIFLKTDAANMLQARAVIDHSIKELYESGIIPQTLVLPNFNPPCQGDTPRISAGFQSYANVLANLGNPHEEAINPSNNPPPPRPTKCNIPSALPRAFPYTCARTEARSNTSAPSAGS
jgi:hypothetical protein